MLHDTLLRSEMMALDPPVTHNSLLRPEMTMAPFTQQSLKKLTTMAVMMCYQRRLLGLVWIHNTKQRQETMIASSPQQPPHNKVQQRSAKFN